MLSLLQLLSSSHDCYSRDRTQRAVMQPQRYDICALRLQFLQLTAANECVGGTVSGRAAYCRCRRCRWTMVALAADCDDGDDDDGHDNGANALGVAVADVVVVVAVGLERSRKTMRTIWKHLRLHPLMFALTLLV